MKSLNMTCGMTEMVHESDMHILHTVSLVHFRYMSVLLILSAIIKCSFLLND